MNAFAVNPHSAAISRSQPQYAGSFGRGETIYDPWHYVPVLARKLGALRNGAPFKDWVLPAAMERVRRKLADADDGNLVPVSSMT
jgi:hypothetical protein